MYDKSKRHDNRFVQYVYIRCSCIDECRKFGLFERGQIREKQYIYIYIIYDDRVIRRAARIEKKKKKKKKGWQILCYHLDSKD